MSLRQIALSVVVAWHAFAAVAHAAAPIAVDVRIRVAAQPAGQQKTTTPKPEPLALKVYQTRCAICHGDAGAGDGSAAQGLMIRPRRFSDAMWQERVDDTHIKKAILEGGFAVKKSSTMPPHPDLAADIEGLVRVVRSFRCPNGSVTVDVVDAAGKSVTTGGADLKADGTSAVTLSVAAGSYDVVVRASGHPSELCKLPIVVADKPQTLSCAPGTLAVSTGAP